MRTQTPRIRQLTFQLEHPPCVLTRRALAAAATAPSHPLPQAARENIHFCRWRNRLKGRQKEFQSCVFVQSTEGAAPPPRPQVRGFRAGDVMNEESDVLEANQELRALKGNRHHEHGKPQCHGQED